MGYNSKHKIAKNIQTRQRETADMEQTMNTKVAPLVHTRETVRTLPTPARVSFGSRDRNQNQNGNELEPKIVPKLEPNQNQN